VPGGAAGGPRLAIGYWLLAIGYRLFWLIDDQISDLANMSAAFGRLLDRFGRHLQDASSRGGDAGARLEPDGGSGPRTSSRRAQDQNEDVGGPRVTEVVARPQQESARLRQRLAAERAAFAERLAAAKEEEEEITGWNLPQRVKRHRA